MNLPIPSYGKDDKETIRNLMDVVMRLRKELEYMLYHLDEDNVPELTTIKGLIEGNNTQILQTEQAITLLAEDVTGNTSAINLQAGQISSIVSSVSGQSSAITQLSNQISLKLDSGQFTAGIIVDMINGTSLISIDADKINLNGITTLDGLTRISSTLDLGLNNQEGRINIGKNFSTGQAGAVISSYRAQENYPGIQISAIETRMTGGTFKVLGESNFSMLATMVDATVSNSLNVKNLTVTGTTTGVRARYV